jgi:deoxyribonuclease V
MKVHHLHRWDLDPAEAVALQRELAARVDVATPLGECRLVAGADISYNRFSSVFYAGVVVLRLPEMEVVEEQ